MTATWPSTLPRPNRSAYQARPSEARLRRAQEAGPPRYRRRSSSVARAVTLAFDLDRAQKAVFDDFFAETTAAGSLPFTMPDPVTDGWPMRTAGGEPVLDDGGQPVLMSNVWTCLFGDDLPTETLVAPLVFRITFTVWVLP